MTAPALRALALTDFRNLDGVDLHVDAPAVVVLGPNGAGKTNLLEAASLLAPGRGLRRAATGEIGRRRADESSALARAWSVRARLTPALGEGETDIVVGADAQKPDRKVLRIDGAPQRSLTALAQVLTVAWVTPPMDRLFQEGAGPRRRFLDRIAFSFEPGHAARLSGYEQAMKERLRLLKNGVRDRVWLAALEERMSVDGAAVTAARRRWAARLTQAAAAGQGVFPAAQLRISGGDPKDAPPLADDADLDEAAWAERLREAFALARRVDTQAGTTSIGPHRADLAATHGGTGAPAARCSTGEQKALLLALVLAQARLLAAERGAPPLLLLDEATAHLDQLRRDALFAEILALGGQAWFSGVDAAPFATLMTHAACFDCQDGRVTPRGP